MRAAAMGTVALVGMGRNGRSRGMRGLGVAVLGLLLVWPRLAVTAGFALSVLATAGILLLAPVWRDALMRWTPRWVAEAVSVPLAAQVACTPVVAAISGQVSLVAVGANLLAAPAVAPGDRARALRRVAGPAVEPARRRGRGPGGVVGRLDHRGRPLGRGRPDGGGRLGHRTGAARAAHGAVPASRCPSPRACSAVRRRPSPAPASSLVVMLVRPPTPGWPPRGWVLAVCDVGPGRRARPARRPGAAVVVDAGPEPASTDACLDRLEVTAVPLLVLTHFHADHVGGVAGVLDGREVGEVEGTVAARPARGRRALRHARSAATPAGGVRPDAAGRRRDPADGVAPSRCPCGRLGGERAQQRQRRPRRRGGRGAGPADR